MSKLFQYSSTASGQTSKILTRPTAGLNEYLPSVSINDNLMSEMIDAFSYKDECIEMYGNSALTVVGISNTAGKGVIRAAINSDESTSDIDIFYLMTVYSTTWKLIRHSYTHSTNTTSISEFSMTMSVTPSVLGIVDSSSTIFKTEVDTYYVFSNTCEQRMHFIKHTATANTYGYVNLPSFPKKIISHANRIFFIDTQNKIWWCRAGDLYSWYAMEYDSDAIVAARNCAVASFTILAQPNTTRQLTATVTKTNTLDTLGTLTIVGTNGLGEAQTAILTLAEGRVQTSMAFKTVTSIYQEGWVLGGATPDIIEVGVAPVGLGFVTEDAGFFTLEQELAIYNMCVIENAIYIFSNHNIYVFRGTSPDSFSISNIVSDIGIDRMVNPNGYNKLVSGHNYAYFIYNGSIYEFNGNDIPKIISRPVTINGQSSNGIFGGINFTGEQWVLSSTAQSLCLYDYTSLSGVYYLYNFETKTWWKKSGIIMENLPTIATAIKTMYTASFNRSKWYTFISNYDSIAGYGLVLEQGMIQGDNSSFVITKAFNSSPSETGTLTEIILAIKGVLSNSASIKVQYSLTVDSDDFSSIKEFDHKIFNGDLEILSIPVPVSNIANAHHYRIKIIISDFSSTNPVYLYNIERRFRVKGRSR